MSNQTGIPADLHSIFEQLKQDVMVLFMHWSLYCQLFTKGPERVELLNCNAGLFFAHLQNVYANYTILSICRITDRTRTSVRRTMRDNLVLKQLIERLDAQQYPILHQEMLDLYSKVDDDLQPFQDNRNWVIAHRDMQAALPVNTQIVPGITKAMIEKKLAQISNYLNHFEYFTYNQTTLYDMVITSGNGDYLVTALKKAYEYNQMVTADEIPRSRLLQSRYWKA